MERPEELNTSLLPHLFRQEFAKMTAFLCRRFGLANIGLAEDVTGDTFLKASEHWAVHGVPENPTAWLYTVAKNKLKDHYRHLDIFEKHVKLKIAIDEYQLPQETELFEQEISDSLLAMIFAVCNPVISKDSQLCLALQILCGFSLEEIANALLIKSDTVKKRLQRARKVLRESNFKLEHLTATQIPDRFEVVLRTIYLMFNEGYYSKTKNKIISKELCSEAIRLALILTKSDITTNGETYALLALMCYQSSRLDARVDPNGEPIPFEQQDKARWDDDLISKGNYYLVNACSSTTATKYHLEAGIAYWHTIEDNGDKWKYILELYDKLLKIDNSPVVALNRIFAFGKVHGNKKAIAEARQFNSFKNSAYYELLAFLHEEVDLNSSLLLYEKAIGQATSKAQKDALHKNIIRLKGQNSSFISGI